MRVDSEALLNILRTHFSAGAQELTFLKEGWFSQAFGFLAEGRAYIVRLNAWEVDFQKDVFAGLHLAGPELPVPPVLQTGRFDERLFYAITPRCAGRDLSDCDAETRRRLAPDLFACLDALYRWDSSALPGWGLTDGRMVGLFSSWPHYLSAFYNQKFSYSLNDLAGTFFEPDLYAAALAAQARDFRYLPTQKWLIHGDYGYNNVVSDGKTITGVLDWAEARLGDYLCDICNLDYWEDSGIPYLALWQEYVARGGGPTRGAEEPHFHERVRCYTIGAAAGDLRLSAYRNDYEVYQLAKKKLAPYV